jgi:peptide-methionine (S)-S-oxide reductase
MTDSEITHTVQFGAGCFWGVEAAFRKLDGVVDAAVGYAGGKTDNPTYKDVCSGTTGHAEVVQVEYDPTKISFEQLLVTFFSTHDPTQFNRQGPDVGSQYRSAVFFTTPEQQATVNQFISDLEQSGRLNRPIVTEVKPAPTFWRAEEYHQRYFEKQGGGHCHV